MASLVDADGQRDAEGIAVFHRDRTFHIDRICGKADAVIVGRRRRLYHAQRRRVLSAKGHLGLIVCHRLIAGARTADGTRRDVLSERGELLLRMAG